MLVALAMLRPVVVDRQPTEVMYVACADELPAIRGAWDALEAVVPLRGRRFFGASYEDGTYRACVQRLPGETVSGLEEGELPGGRYLRRRLRGEPPEVYDGIADAARGPRDPDRPIIEHYRRRDEIDVLLPVP
jgi:hypothetical protein